MEKLFDDLRNRWLDFEFGFKFYDDSNKSMQVLKEEWERETVEIWKLLDKSANKGLLWESKDSRTLSAGITTNYVNIRALARSYCNPYSKFYKNSMLLEDILFCLDWLYDNIYNTVDVAYGNWWDWEIGIPKPLNEVLLLLYGEISEEKRNNYLKSIDRFVPDPYCNNRSVKPYKKVRSVGANLVDICIVKLQEGILKNNSLDVLEVTKSLNDLFYYVEKGDGFYRDGSFIQHENIPYNGSYGMVLLEGLSFIINLLDKTKFSLKQSQKLIIKNWCNKSIFPFIYKGNMMDMVRGRAISRNYLQSSVAGANVIRSVMKLESIFEKDEYEQIKKQIILSVKENKENYDYVDDLTNIYDINLIYKILSSKNMESHVCKKNELFNFANMDRIVFRNRHLDFAIGISYSSQKTKRYEYMNNENKKGWYTGDGVLYCYDSDTTSFNHDYWATVDPYHLPGATVELTQRFPGDGYHVPEQKAVGGAVLNSEIGSFMYDFVNDTNTLSGKKSWFVLNEKIVSVGSDITFKEGYNVETTIENLKLNPNVEYKLYVNNETIDMKISTNRLDNIKTIFLKASNPKYSRYYTFSSPATLIIKINEQNGSWYDVNSAGSKEKISAIYFCIIKQHLKKHDNYQYTIFPSYEGKSTQEDHSIEIIRADDSTIAIADLTHKIKAINHFNSVSDSVGKFSFSQPVSIVEKKSTKGIHIAVAEPTMEENELVIYYDRQDIDIDFFDNNIKCEKQLFEFKPYWKITIDSTNSRGQSSHIYFKNTEKRE